MSEQLFHNLVTIAQTKVNKRVAAGLSVSLILFSLEDERVTVFADKATRTPFNQDHFDRLTRRAVELMEEVDMNNHEEVDHVTFDFKKRQVAVSIIRNLVDQIE